MSTILCHGLGRFKSDNADEEKPGDPEAQRSREQKGFFCGPGPERNTLKVNAFSAEEIKFFLFFSVPAMNKNVK